MPAPNRPSAQTAQTGKSAFLNAFKKSPKLAQGLKHVSEAKDPNNIKIDDGTYAALVCNCVFGEYKGVPTVRLYFKVSGGPFKGTLLNKRYEFGKVSDSSIDEDELLNRIGVDLARLGKENVPPQPAAMAEAFEEIASEGSEVQLGVKTVNGFVRVYVNKLLKQGTGTTAQTEADAGDDGQGDGTDDQHDDQNDGQDDQQANADDGSSSGDDDPPVEVEDLVRYTPKGAKKPVKCEVTKSDPRKQLCELKQVNGNQTFSKVPWDHVQFVMQGEE